MRDSERVLVEAIHRQAVGCIGAEPPGAAMRQGTHHAQLPAIEPDGPLGPEWNTYRGVVGRLLAEGQEGRHVLIKGEEIIGIFDAWDMAREAGLKRFLLEPFLVHRICSHEPFLRIRGVNAPWPN